MPSSEFSTALAELPPRTRRILMLQLQLAMETGTTSAHAENTELLRISCPRTRNYLRARGEYSSQVALHRPDLGTTSAHAENTWF